MTEVVARSSARSYLYVPGDRQDLVAKALGGGADAVILDLEDGVAPSAKDAARRVVAETVALPRSANAPGPEIWVRVNPGAEGIDEIRQVAGPSLHGVCLAKVDGAREVIFADNACSAVEEAHDVAAGSIRLMPLLESAAAVLDARSIAVSSQRIAALQVGEADLWGELGADPFPGDPGAPYVRTAVLLASAAAGLRPPVGPVDVSFDDVEEYRASTMALRRAGFRSRACIHPVQVEVVNRVFAPSPSELRAARELVDAYDEAIRLGRGVITNSDGDMVDAATVRVARQLLDEAAARQRD